MAVLCTICQQGSAHCGLHTIVCIKWSACHKPLQVSLHTKRASWQCAVTGWSFIWGFDIHSHPDSCQAAAWFFTLQVLWQLSKENVTKRNSSWNVLQSWRRIFSIVLPNRPLRTILMFLIYTYICDQSCWPLKPCNFSVLWCASMCI